MIPFLRPLLESLWVKIFIAIFATTIITGGAYYATASILFLIQPIPILAGVFSGFIVAFVLGRAIAEDALKTTDYLVRAMMIATNKKADITIPDKHSLGRPAREYIGKLAEQVMNLADSTQQLSNSSNKELSFFKTSLNAMSLPVVIVNSDQKIVFANEQAIKYAERNTEDVLDQLFYDVYNLSFVSDATLETWLETCRDGAVVENDTWDRVRINLPNNKRKQFDLAAHYRKDDTNDIELVLVFFDRTVHYERDDHDLSFVSLAVHELRTPLTIMRGYIEVFQDEIGDKLDSEQKSFMFNMSASAQQLTSFVSNILNVTRIEENALYLKLKREVWGDLLQSYCRDMQLRASVHGKKIVVNIEDNLPEVAADKVSMYEVINNLLDNAIKYTHTNEEIIVHTYKKDSFVETTITDKGVGIPQNLIGHIFDKFYRAHSSKNSVGGTGLGLYLCKAIITSHGGSIWVQSKENEGSTFGFTLPTYESVAHQLTDNDNKEITRGAHGWIKNHSLYRG